MSAPALPGHQVFLLAAGRGRRAGGPKAWRLIDGRPALEAQLEALREVFTPESVHVSIQPGWLERCRALDARVRWVETDPDAPPMRSLQALVRAARADMPAFAYHVDMGPYPAAVFAALARALGDLDAAVPVFGGRRGHPALLSPRLLPRVLSAQRLDRLLQEVSAVGVEVVSDAVTTNHNE